MSTLNLIAQESSYLQYIGLKPVEWGLDSAVFELTVAPEHLNRFGVLHGGILSSMIDTAGGFAGCYAKAPLQPRQAVTLSITTSFTGQIRGGTLRVTGHKRAGGRKTFFSSVEVVDLNGVLIAFGEGTYRYIDKRGSAPS